MIVTIVSCVAKGHVKRFWSKNTSKNVDPFGLKKALDTSQSVLKAACLVWHALGSCHPIWNIKAFPDLDMFCHVWSVFGGSFLPVLLIACLDHKNLQFCKVNSAQLCHPFFFYLLRVRDSITQ